MRIGWDSHPSIHFFLLCRNRTNDYWGIHPNFAGIQHTRWNSHLDFERKASQPLPVIHSQDFSHSPSVTNFFHFHQFFSECPGFGMKPSVNLGNLETSHQIFPSFVYFFLPPMITSVPGSPTHLNGPFNNQPFFLEAPFGIPLPGKSLPHSNVVQPPLLVISLEIP